MKLRDDSPFWRGTTLQVPCYTTVGRSGSSVQMREQETQRLALGMRSSLRLSCSNLLKKKGKGDAGNQSATTIAPRVGRGGPAACARPEARPRPRDKVGFQSSLHQVYDSTTVWTVSASVRNNQACHVFRKTQESQCDEQTRN